MTDVVATISCYFKTDGCSYRIPVVQVGTSQPGPGGRTALLCLRVDRRAMRIHYRHAHGLELDEEQA